METRAWAYRHGRAGVVLALAACPGVAAPDPGVAPEHPPLSIVATVIESSSAAERADFAYIALDEMRAAFQDEAGTALEVARTLEIGNDEVRWARATDAYGARLGELASRIGPDTDVRLYADPSGSVGLFVAGESVLVSGPRIGQPGQLAARILDRYCAIQVCDWPEAEALPAEPAPLLATEITWAFRHRGRPICRSDDGLSLGFDSLDRLDAKRRACSSAVTELRALAREIAHQTGRGAHVDWTALRVESLGDGRGEHVRIDRSGKYLLMRLPTLAMAPDLVARTRAWIAARSRGRIEPVEIRDAERLLLVVFDAAPQ